MALTSTAQLKTHLGVSESDTSDDLFHIQLLSAVESAFKKLTDRDIEATDYVAFECGNNTKVLLLAEYPVISITGVWLDDGAYWGTASGAFAAATELTAGTDYALIKDSKSGASEAGRLYKINGVWPGRWLAKQGLLAMAMKPGAGNIKISYRAGNVTCPEDIQLCLWQVCARLASERESGRAIQSERFEDYAVTFMQADAEEAMRVGTAAQVVAKYRRITPRIKPLG